MNKQIFQAIFGTSLIVILFTAIVLLGILNDYFTKTEFTELRSETELTAAGVELNGSAYLDAADMDKLRVTWIATDGSVIYDNSTNTGTMENHLERAEVQEAIATGFGTSSRYSDTLSEKCLYTAKRLSDGSVLRLSVSHDAIWTLLLGIAQPLCVAVFASIVVSMTFAYKLSGKEYQ